MFTNIFFSFFRLFTMPKKHSCDSEEEFFRKMVEAHKPVPDVTPAVEAVAQEIPDWQKKFWETLAQPTPSTSTEQEKPKETGARPKTSRRSSTRVTPPSDPEEDLMLRALYDVPYETPKWLENKMKIEGKSYPKEKYLLFKAVPGGQVQIKRKDTVMMPFDIKTNKLGNQYLDYSEKHLIWHELEKLNLKDPKVIEEVRKACSSKPEEKVDESSNKEKKKSDKKSKKKDQK